MNRRTVIKALAATPLLTAAGARLTGEGILNVAAAQDASPSASYSLLFDRETYTVESKTVTTETGDIEVTYRLYAAIPYVSNPVDVAYQSLNVLEPVAIDGVAVDATNAPILFSNSVGGYMSSPVSSDGSTPGMGAAGGGLGEMPAGTPPGGDEQGVPTGSAEMVRGGQRVSNADLALASGYVVVAPGARGRENVAADGTFFGKAPAAIVDLKAAARYVHANAGRIPGNTDWLISSGTSAGGALSALLGASADSDRYLPYLQEIGAASASDAMFAVASFCPITDLDHADMAYEWMFGPQPLRDAGDTVDQDVSQALRSQFPAYLASLGLVTPDGLTSLTAETYGDYLIATFLAPSATSYLANLDDTGRATYLTQNPWITWANGAATFTLQDFQDHVGRSKNVPAFDALDLSAGENGLFGNTTTDARHFTEFSLREAPGNSTATLDADLPEKIALMNPMTFLGDEPNPARARHWWLRVGTSDTDTSLSIVGNLAAALDAMGDDVNTRMYWDAGHGANEDAPALMAWIAEITGYQTS